MCKILELSPRRRPVGLRGFSMVELMVAIAVLTLLLVTVTSLLTGATLVTRQNRRTVDADSEARMIFDRLAKDFDGMIKRRDVDYIFAHAVGNDALFFYSESPALADPTASAQNTLALIGYRINSKYQLERFGKGLVWGAAAPDGMAFLTYSKPYLSGSIGLVPDPASTFSNAAWTQLIGNPPNYSDVASTAYHHVLGESVFRFEICFLLKPWKQQDGTVVPATYSNLPYASQNISNAVVPAAPQNLYGIGPDEIQAIVVTIAILDKDSRTTVTTPNLQTMASKFSDPTDADLASTPPKLMAETWNGQLRSASFAGIPKIAVDNIRIYQRTFYLGTFLN